MVMELGLLIGCLRFWFKPAASQKFPRRLPVRCRLQRSSLRSWSDGAKSRFARALLRAVILSCWAWVTAKSAGKDSTGLPGVSKSLEDRFSRFSKVRARMRALSKSLSMAACTFSQSPRFLGRGWLLNRLRPGGAGLRGLGPGVRWKIQWGER